jgi:hypothetical protein
VIIPSINGLRSVGLGVFGQVREVEVRGWNHYWTAIAKLVYDALLGAMTVSGRDADLMDLVAAVAVEGVERWDIEYL